jgi:hypothetical protein
MVDGLDYSELECHSSQGGCGGSGGVFPCSCLVASNLDLT